MKDIKDYLHLYLLNKNCNTETGGCINSRICNLNDKCQCPNGIEVYIFPIETLTNGWLSETLKNIPSIKPTYQLTFENYKKTIQDGYLPVLRPLSDMTEEEKEDFADHGYDFEDDGELPVNIWKGVNMSGHILWLLSKGFDLFNLIPAGLAIDKTKLTT